MLLENEFKHTGTTEMWLILPKRHLVDAAELTVTDWLDFGELYRYCREKLVPSGALVMRFGNPSMHAGTIPHLHANVIMPTCGIEYRAPFAKDLDWHEDDYRRMIEFLERIKKSGDEEWLLSEEGIRETQP